MSAANPPRVSPAEVASFLDRFRAFRDTSGEGKLRAFKSGFQRLAEGLKPLQAAAAERARQEAPAFNVFRILRLERREVTTHTPFLANLLDPAGSHAQGDLFLRLFWERLELRAKNERSVQVPALIPGSRWSVHRERFMLLGNFDIHLLCTAMKCQMVIENKIGAGDERDQLRRYWDEMERELSRFPHRLLVYLTPRTRDPQNYTGKLPPFVNLTYKDDLAPVLTQALESIVAPRLRSTLEQYLDIIESF